MITWPDTLVRDIALKKCIVILGAGVSMNSTNAHGVRPKLWLQFLEDANAAIPDVKKRKAIKKILKSNDLLLACELIKCTLTRQVFIDHMVDAFQTPGFNPAHIHELIFKLDYYTKF
jgi:hypothetical protein